MKEGPEWVPDVHEDHYDETGGRDSAGSAGHTRVLRVETGPGVRGGLYSVRGLTTV